MMMAFTTALVLLLAVLAVPVIVLFAETAMARPLESRESMLCGPRPNIAVLVPAHNEGAGIIAALESIFAGLAPADRLLVVADNCSDDTAQVAAALGAEVIERHDPVHRGKGYALDFGVRHLDAEPPDVLVIVDADCRVAPHAIETIATLSAAMQRPVQAIYLIRSPNASRSRGVAEFACRVKNLVRPLGLHRLGLPCQLMGSGMAIPWAAVRTVRLATSNIVEDMKMGLDLARAGFPPLFCPAALVESTFPANEEGAESQRTRWEHGHLALLVNEGPLLLVDGVRQRAPALFALALDLCVPPVSLLCLLISVMLVAAATHAILASSAVVLAAAALIATMFMSAIFLAWLRFGRDVMPLSSIGHSALYALTKVPVYVRFVINRQVEWVRSKRDEG